MRYHQIINELFDSSLGYEWTHKSDSYWEAKLIVDGIEYLITATQEEGFIDKDTKAPVPLWELSFGLTSDGFSGTKVIGTNGNEMAIFATVLTAFKEFLSTVKPETFAISASKQNENRFKLYQRMAKRMAQELAGMGYSTTTCPIHAHVDVTKSFDSMCFTRY